MQPDPKPGRDERQEQPARTPNADMQADDAGTPDSQPGEAGGTAAESAMKQEHKTDAEGGDRR
jgi:hypothetical protein